MGGAGQGPTPTLDESARAGTGHTATPAPVATADRRAPHRSSGGIRQYQRCDYQGGEAPLAVQVHAPSERQCGLDGQQNDPGGHDGGVQMHDRGGTAILPVTIANERGAKPVIATMTKSHAKPAWK